MTRAKKGLYQISTIRVTTNGMTSKPVASELADIVIAPVEFEFVEFLL